MKNLDILRKRFGEEKTLEEMAELVNGLESVEWDEEKLVKTISSDPIGDCPCDMCYHSKHSSCRSGICDMILEYIEHPNDSTKFRSETCLDGIRKFLNEEYKGVKESGEDFYSFFKHYNHINYCEIVIYPDGTVAEAAPSHQEKLIKILTNKLQNNREEIRELFLSGQEETDNFQQWLLEETGCVSVWFYHLSFPSIVTKEQVKTIKLLIQNGKVDMTESLYRRFVMPEEAE